MKTKYIKSLLSIIILAGVLLFPACSSDDDGGGIDPSPLDAQLVLLENTGLSWVSEGGAVIKDGFDVSDQYEGFKLTIAGKSYATVNSLSGVWANSGTWDFKDGSLTTIDRNDGVVITINNISSTRLTLSFTDPSGSGGRYSSIPGDYVFTLISE